MADRVIGIEKKINIQRAKIEDAEEIWRLQRTCFATQAELYGDHNLPPLRQSVDEIKRDMKDYIYLKANQNQRIVGAVRGIQENDSAHISRLIVGPEYQNYGIGTKLMRKIEQEFIMVNEYELFTGWRSKKSIHLYKKLGYEVFGEGMPEYSMKILMMKKKRIL